MHFKCLASDTMMPGFNSSTRMSMPNLASIGQSDTIPDPPPRVSYSYNTGPVTSTFTPSSSLNTSNPHQHQSSKPRALSARTYQQNHPAPINATGSMNSVYVQEVVALSKVSANFALDLDSMYAPVIASHSAKHKTPEMSVNGYGFGQESNGEAWQDTGHERVNLPKRVNFENIPLMLLPKARPRGRQDFMDYVRALRGDTVMANDPRSQLILSSQFGNGVQGRPQSAVSAVSSSSSTVEKINRSVSLPPESYIDSFADFRDVINSAAGKKRRRKVKITPEQVPHAGEWKDLCPHCLKLFENFGGKQKLVEWILSKLATQVKCELL